MAKKSYVQWRIASLHQIGLDSNVCKNILEVIWLVKFFLDKFYDCILKVFINQSIGSSTFQMLSREMHYFDSVKFCASIKPSAYLYSGLHFDEKDANTKENIFSWKNHQSNLISESAFKISFKSLGKDFPASSNEKRVIQAPAAAWVVSARGNLALTLSSLSSPDKSQSPHLILNHRCGLSPKIHAAIDVHQFQSHGSFSARNRNEVERMVSPKDTFPEKLLSSRKNVPNNKEKSEKNVIILFENKRKRRKARKSRHKILQFLNETSDLNTSKFFCLRVIVFLRMTRFPIFPVSSAQTYYAPFFTYFHNENRLLNYVILLSKLLVLLITFLKAVSHGFSFIFLVSTYFFSYFDWGYLRISSVIVSTLIKLPSSLLSILHFYLLFFLFSFTLQHAVVLSPTQNPQIEKSLFPSLKFLRFRKTKEEILTRKEPNFSAHQTSSRKVVETREGNRKNKQRKKGEGDRPANGDRADSGANAGTTGKEPGTTRGTTTGFSSKFPVFLFVISVLIFGVGGTCPRQCVCKWKVSNLILFFCMLIQNHIFLYKNINLT